MLVKVVSLEKELMLLFNVWLSPANLIPPLLPDDSVKEVSIPLSALQSGEVENPLLSSGSPQASGWNPPYKLLIKASLYCAW